VPVLYHCHIDEYSHGNRHNHNPVRPRKILMSKREIDRFRAAVEQRGRSIIPLRIYFKQGLAKVEIAVAMGKKFYDKREDVKRREALREAERAVVASRR
jgi:SsrA-binding protein